MGARNTTEAAHSDRFPAPEKQPTDAEYSVETVATHRTEADCWIIVGGVVYDVTGYLDEHPGGPHWITEVMVTSWFAVSHPHTPSPPPPTVTAITPHDLLPCCVCNAVRGS